MEDDKTLIDGEPSLQLRALEVARNMIGLGENGGNNRGEALDSWRRETMLPGGSWCALWICYAYLRASQYGRSIQPVPFDFSSSAKKLTRNVGNAGQFIDTPEPGALICWHRGTLGWTGHVELVETYKPGELVTIAGNVGSYPSKIHRRTYNYEWRNRLYRIAIPTPKIDTTAKWKTP
jgi:hypothetical protein